MTSSERADKLQEILDRYAAQVEGLIKTKVRFRVRRDNTPGTEWYDKMVDIHLLWNMGSGHAGCIGGWQMLADGAVINPMAFASWEMHEMPGCCGVCIVCHTRVSESQRKKGVGALLNQMQQELARALNYSLLLGADVERNTPQRKILERNGWMDLIKFKNSRSLNVVVVSAIDLHEKEA